MPSHWIGTTEDRYAALDRAKRRCDGNNHRCVHSATISYDLLPANDFIVIPDGEPVRKQSCSRHVQQFINNQKWAVMGSRRLAGRRIDGAVDSYGDSARIAS
jgi:hypothetical protein